MRTIIFDEDGPHDAGDLDAGELHNTIARAVGEPELGRSTVGGYVFAMSPCITCGKVFSYNPHRVPSTSAITGSREPVCRSCMDLITPSA